MSAGEAPHGNDPRRDGAVFDPRRVRRGAGAPVLTAAAVAGIALLAGLLYLVREDLDPSTAFLPPPGPQAVVTAAPASLEPELLVIDLRPAGSNLFVHGDVFSASVVLVVVSLRDPNGRTVTMEAVDIPTGSTAFRTEPNDRFTVRFQLPDEVMGEGLWIVANAYDRRGFPIARTLTPVIPNRVVPM